MEIETSSEGIDLTTFPDRVLAGPLAHQVLEMLKQSEEAAKHVYIVLSLQFGIRK